jgi:hypothetical protein
LQSIVDAEWNIIYDKLAKCVDSGAQVRARECAPLASWQPCDPGQYDVMRRRQQGSGSCKGFLRGHSSCMLWRQGSLVRRSLLQGPMGLLALGLARR